MKEAKRALWEQMRRFVAPETAREMLVAYAETHPEMPASVQEWTAEDYRRAASDVRERGAKSLEEAATLLIARDGRTTKGEPEPPEKQLDTPERRAELMTRIQKACDPYGLGLEPAHAALRKMGIERPLHQTTAAEREKVLEAIEGEDEHGRAR